MNTRLEDEKELLMMKGDVLRMKLCAQARITKRNVYDPVYWLGVIGSSLNRPIVRSLLLTLLGEKLLTARNVVLSGLGITARWLLSKDK